MFETLGFETLTAPEVAPFFGLALGLLFGLLAERTAFCLRRAVVGEDRKQARGVWLMALATALIGTQAAVSAGLISFADHRFHSANLPFAAILIGGGLFGAGMVLARGCISRLTVLGAGGNLRALTVVLIVAVTAHATIKGVLAPIRTTLASLTLDLGEATGFAALPGGALFWTALFALAALTTALTSGNRKTTLALAALLGLLVPAGWVGTGFVLFDDFDPIAMESLSFTAPASEALFYTIASTAIGPTFGAALIAGVLLGAFASTAQARRFKWQSFSSPRETGRYALGAVLMGSGGALAGGCTVGAGLSGVPTLSFAATLALLAIIIGGWATNALLSGISFGSSAPSATRSARQAA